MSIILVDERRYPFHSKNGKKAATIGSFFVNPFHTNGSYDHCL
ncbi:hypothetical protein [Paenibacillus sp. N3/727]|nr:hypothetical protein [Paenibacillus sp. N3/727]